MSAIETLSIKRRGHSPRTGTPSRHRPTGSFLLAALQRIEALAARRRSRLALMSMSDDQLKDIGVSRADAYREGIRGFWE